MNTEIKRHLKEINKLYRNSNLFIFIQKMPNNEFFTKVIENNQIITISKDSSFDNACNYARSFLEKRDIVPPEEFYLTSNNIELIKNPTIKKNRKNKKPFSDITLLSNGTLINRNFRVYDIKHIIKQFNNGVPIPILSDKYNVLEFNLEKLILMYNSGAFDEIMDIWDYYLISENDFDFKKIINNNAIFILHEGKEIRKPFENLKISRNKTIFNGETNLNISFEDLRSLVNEYYHGEDINYLKNRFRISDFYKLHKLILRYEYGDFNGLKNQITKIEEKIDSIIDYENSRLKIFIKERIDQVFIVYTQIDDEIIKEGIFDSLEEAEEFSINYLKDKKIQPPKTFDISLTKKEVIKRTKRNSKPFKDLVLLSNGQILENDFTIDNVINIFEDYNNHVDINTLVENYNLLKNTVERIILRYEYGDFNDIIEIWTTYKKTNSNSKLIVPLNTNSVIDKPFDHLQFINGVLFEDEKNLKLTSDEFYDLIDSYYNEIPIEHLKKTFNIDESLLFRIINRANKNDFKDILNEKSENNDIQLSVNNITFKKTRRNSRPYSDLIIGSDGTFINEEGFSLNFTKDDLVSIIQDYNHGIDIDALSKKYDMRTVKLERMIFRFSEGDFDKFL
ncbi:MAG: hypothetical protein Q4Q19_03980 [Methanobrevibacter sp.]|nr:hypothetical protein [Methanobrevibacter sp.]